MASGVRERDDLEVGDASPLWLPGFSPASRRRRLRRPSNGASTLLLVVALAALVAGTAIVAMAQSGKPTRQATSNVHAHARTGSHAVPVTVPPAPPTTVASAAPAVAASSGPGGRVVSAVPVDSGAVSNVTDPSAVATALVPTIPLFTAPGAPAPARTLANPNYLGATVVLLVTGYQDGWVQAYVPMRPNESTAWIPAADVSISFVPCHIGIGIGAHKLVLYCNNAPVFETTVATGAPSSPTPTGSYFVAYIVKLTDPGDAYGPYALGTSAFSNTYYSFEGGPGQVGIHGTNQPWVIGGYASHGCVRLTNQAITTLAQQIAPGTPVEIAP